MKKLEKVPLKASNLEVIKLLIPELSIGDLEELDVVIWSAIAAKDPNYFSKLTIASYDLPL